MTDKTPTACSKCGLRHGVISACYSETARAQDRMTDKTPPPLNEDMDAMRWAREFCAQFKVWSDKGVESDPEGLMVAWFANAIMAGYDNATRKARAALAAAQPEEVAPADERGWLIEMRFGGGLLWWSGEFDRARDDFRGARLSARMVNDAGKAVRFARQEDAQRVLDAMLAARPCPIFQRASELYSVQEHLWPAPIAAAPQAAEAAEPVMITRLAFPASNGPAVARKCDIRMDDSSAQPVSAPRCMTCGEWRSEPCQGRAAEKPAEAAAPQERLPRTDLLDLFDLYADATADGVYDEDARAIAQQIVAGLAVAAQPEQAQQPLTDAKDAAR